MAIHLGLKYGSSPGWFYDLEPRDRVRVLAYERWVSERQASRKSKTKTSQLREGITVSGEDASGFWFSDG